MYQCEQSLLDYTGFFHDACMIRPDNMQYITLRDITFFSNFSHSEIYMSTGLAEATTVISGDQWKYTLKLGRDDDDKLYCSVKLKDTAELIQTLQTRSRTFPFFVGPMKNGKSLETRLLKFGNKSGSHNSKNVNTIVYVKSELLLISHFY